MVLAAIHAMLVLLVYGQHYEGSWGYVLFSIPDLPAMLIVALVNKVIPLSFSASWLLIGALGSLWWYLIGTWLNWVFRGRR